MKIELELKQDELAQLMYALGIARAVLIQEESESEYYTAHQTLRGLVDIIVQQVDGGTTARELVRLSRHLKPGGYTV